MEKEERKIGADEILKDVKYHLEAFENNKPESLNEVLKRLEVKASEKISPPQIAWEQRLNESKAILGTLGNFSLIIGKAKSKKSFFINIAVSVVLKNNSLFNQFTGCLPSNKRKVIYFDTEQGRYHVQLALKRICEQTGIKEPVNLKVYGLRSQSPAERLKLIEHAICSTTNLGFVVIDGVKDLITSINDEAEATMIASKLLKWTEERNIHIVSVLHQNKSDNNARGHIGTELLNKAETVLSVTISEQDKEVSIVEAQMCRNKEPIPFAFKINDEGLPKLVEDFEIKTETRRKIRDIISLEDYKKHQLLNEVYSKEVSFGYSELVTQIKLAYRNQHKNNVGNNKCKELITYCKNQNWLIQKKTKGPYELGQFKNDKQIEDI